MELLRSIALPNGSKHVAAYLTVKPGYAVGLLTGVECEYRHRELAFAWSLTTQVHEVSPVDTELGSEVRHILVEETLLKVVMSCRYWSVAGVELRAANHLKCLVELQALILDEVGHTLCTDKGSVTLVAVINILLDAKLVEQQHTADAEQVLLLDAVLPVTTIELVSDAAVPLRVAVEVGVEQIELHAAYIYLPYVGIDNYIIVVRHFEYELCAILILHGLDRELCEVLGLVVGLLAAIGREGLGEVTETIEETYGTEVDVRIRSLLHIVAGKDAETT